MKKLFTTVALVALAATPVLAQQAQNRAPHRERTVAPQAYTAQAQQQRHATSRSNDVYDIHGNYVGSDPDPTIRAQMSSDPSQSD